MEGQLLDFEKRHAMVVVGMWQRRARSLVVEAEKVDKVEMTGTVPLNPLDPVSW
jgi:hypothetical protein